MFLTGVTDLKPKRIIYEIPDIIFRKEDLFTLNAFVLSASFGRRKIKQEVWHQQTSGILIRSRGRNLLEEPDWRNTVLTPVVFC